MLSSRTARRLKNGFYYDFEMKHRITPEDFGKIEEEMRKIAKDNQKFERLAQLPSVQAVQVIG
jgi:threonyl-tRNA synthetase